MYYKTWLFSPTIGQSQKIHTFVIVKINDMRLHCTLALLLSLLTILACKSKSSDPLQEAQTTFQQDPSDENYNALLGQLYEGMKVENLEQADKERYLNIGIAAADTRKDVQTSIVFLNNHLREFPDSEKSEEILTALIHNLETTGSSSTVDVLKAALCKRFPQNENAQKYQSTLAFSPDSIVPFIQQIGLSMFPGLIPGNDHIKPDSFSFDNAKNYVDACEAFGMSLPKDPFTPEMLFKAAETANTLKTYQKSFELYDWIMKSYPKHARAPYSLFMKAFTFDSSLRDSTMAAKFYTEFLENYPTHEFADDAKMLFENLGKSEEEMLEMIMNQKKN